MANGKGNGKETKEKIMDLLYERPLGLTIQDVAEAIGVHRQTVAKYILVLEAEGRVHRRVVGSATLHYPKEVFEKSVGGSGTGTVTRKKKRK